MSGKFDLNSANVYNIVDQLITDAAVKTHDKLKQVGINVVFLKNDITVRTAIELANNSVTYHRIPPEQVSNAKKFAHICFWLVKLYPFSYMDMSDMWRLGGKRIVGQGKVHTIDRKREVSEFEKYTVYRINEICALYMFSTLLANDRYDAPTASARITDFLKQKEFDEICRALKYYNYSARSMAMYLEALGAEAIV